MSSTKDNGASPAAKKRRMESLENEGQGGSDKFGREKADAATPASQIFSGPSMCVPLGTPAHYKQIDKELLESYVNFESVQPDVEKIRRTLRKELESRGPPGESATEEEKESHEGVRLISCYNNKGGVLKSTSTAEAICDPPSIISVDDFLCKFAVPRYFES